MVFYSHARESVSHPAFGRIDRLGRPPGIRREALPFRRARSFQSGAEALLEGLAGPSLYDALERAPVAQGKEVRLCRQLRHLREGPGAAGPARLRGARASEAQQVARLERELLHRSERGV